MERCGTLPKCIVEIIPGIFLGNKHASSKLELLKSLDIKFIVNVGGGKNLYEGEFRYHKITLDDSCDVSILPYFEGANNFINESLKDGNVLVHCRGGFSRSPTVVIAYLIKFHKKSYDDAFVMVKEKRGCIQPNKKFQEELKLFYVKENGAIG